MNDIESFKKEGKVVISDRSFYSSLVYQEPADWIEEINKFVKIPDMVILLDLDLKTSVSRTEGKDEFENEEFLSSVKDKYLELADKHDNFTVIDGNSGPRMVAHNIKIKVAPLLGICKDCITD